MPGKNAFRRIMEIDRLIRAGEYPNAERLAARFGVSRRQIFKDREYLIDQLCAPIANNPDHDGWYYTELTWTLPAVLMTEGELLGLVIGLDVARRALGDPLAESIHKALEKLEKSFRGPVSVDLESVRHSMSFAQLCCLAFDEQTLLALRNAIQRHRRVRMRYYTISRDIHSERTVDPYHLHYNGGDWYLLALDHTRGEKRIFHIGRIEDYVLLEEEFQLDPSFRAEEWLRTGFGGEHSETTYRVAIQFDTQQARWIRERRMHETQEIEELPDGGIILRFSTGGLGAVKRWVLQYGGHAEVLEPEELRLAVIAEIHSALEAYTTSPG